MNSPRPSRPGSRRFVGPLTPAQQRRRERNRDLFQHAAEIADARYIPMGDAIKVATRDRYRLRYDLPA